MAITKKKLDIIITVMIIFVFLFIAFTLYYMIANKEAFVENPFTFGASKMNGDVSCTCVQIVDGNIHNFAFNKTHWWSSPEQEFIVYDFEKEFGNGN